jgi:serine/threonine protein kinase
LPDANLRLWPLSLSLSAAAAAARRYGAQVDWWSFGVLLYEMMGFRTPFYDKNRKMMFHGIITCEPQFPIFFSDEARRTTLFSRLAAHVCNRIRLSVRIGDQRHGTTRRNRRRILRRGRGDAAHPEWRPVFTRR